MSTVHVSGPVIRGRTSPAAVEIEKLSESAQPLRRRYITASRTPLPDSSASEPSGLKILSAATKPRSSVRESSRIPSEPDARVRRAERAHPLRRQLERERLLLEDRVVVTQRLPLLESHGGGLYGPTTKRGELGGERSERRSGGLQRGGMFAPL